MKELWFKTIIWERAIIPDGKEGDAILEQVKSGVINNGAELIGKYEDVSINVDFASQDQLNPEDNNGCATVMIEEYKNKGNKEVIWDNVQGDYSNNN